MRYSRILTVLLFACLPGMCARTWSASLRDDFEDGNATDGRPATWSVGGLPDGERQVINGDYVIDTSSGTSSWVEETVGLSDVSIRTQLRVVESQSWLFAAVFARSPTFASYWGGITHDKVLAIGESFEDGSSATHQQLPTSLDPMSDDIVLQFDVVGDQISLTAWNEGDDIPDSPQLSIRDDTILEGPVGVLVNNGGPAQVAFRYFEVVTDEYIPGLGGLQPGDADMDLDFDQLDLVQVQIAGKYLTGQPATWGEGDWDGGPGGSVGAPPEGDGVFDPFDIVAALGGGLYLSGPYAGGHADLALVAVPEPGSVVLFVTGLLVCAIAPARILRVRLSTTNG